MDDVEAIRGLLATIEAEPTLLPALHGVRAGNQGEVLYRRVADEVHPCLRCGEQARVAYAVRHSHGDGVWRALDLCPGCAVLVTAVIHGVAATMMLEDEREEVEGEEEDDCW